MSNFIKCKDYRINLDFVVDYRCVDNHIAFYMHDGTIEKWHFDDKDEAEDVIKWIDETCLCGSTIYISPNDKIVVTKRNHRGICM